jgi:hypothetical protein
MSKDTHPTLPAGPGLVLPEQVTIALGELAGAAREGLLALAVGTGLGVLHSLLGADVERLVGPKGRHNPDRAAVRHGTQPGRVTLGGRRVRVDRPRVRAVDGSGEVSLPVWEAFAASELLDQLALERMLAKLSTRRYRAGLEPVGAAVEQTATGTSKSAISRRFVAATEHALAELLAADLSGLDLVALMVDGVRVAEHTCVVALGITLDGTKVPLGLAEGATENATVVRDHPRAEDLKYRDVISTLGQRSDHVARPMDGYRPQGWPRSLPHPLVLLDPSGASYEAETTASRAGIRSVRDRLAVVSATAAVALWVRPTSGAPSSRRSHQR